jgi:predicted transcriptional regulator
MPSEPSPKADSVATTMTSVRLPDSDLAELRRIALRDERSVAWLIRRAVREAIERDQAQPKGR